MAGGLPLHRRHLGLPRGRDLLPPLPAGGGRGQLRRGGAARDAAALGLQPRLRDRLGGLADDLGGRRPAVHRDGLAPHARGGRGRERAGGVRRGVREHLQPRGPAPLRRPRPPARVRTRSRCCTTPRPTPSAPRCRRSVRGTTLLVDTYDVAEAVRVGVEVAGPGARRGAARLRRPRGARHAGARAARPARRDAHPDRRHLRPRRARDRRAGRRAGRRLRRRHPAGHRQRAPDLRLRLQAGRAGGRPRRAWSTSPRRARTRSPSAAASTPCAGSTQHGVAEAEVIGIGTAPSGDTNDRASAGAAGRRGRGRRRGAAGASPASGTGAHARSCRCARAAAEGRAGDPDPARKSGVSGSRLLALAPPSRLRCVRVAASPVRQSTTARRSAIRPSSSNRIRSTTRTTSGAAAGGHLDR